MAGFVQFDPDKWQPEATGDGAGECAKVAKAAKPTDAGTQPVPAAADAPALATLATLARLPDDLADGLKRLGQMAAPHCVAAEPWQRAVADAQLLASDGWAHQALSLGWTPLDLFGAVIDAGGDPHGDGLAVWLSGRKVRALSAEGAAVLLGEAGRSYFLRPRAPGARLLWELGSGRG